MKRSINHLKTKHCATQGELQLWFIMAGNKVITIYSFELNDTEGRYKVK